MTESYLARIFAYVILPLLLATGHMLFDRQARTPARRIELFTLYMLAIGIGANGIGATFGHLFLSDVIAEAVGWATGSPFQLEMGFANLVIGVLGVMAIGRLDGFRTATVIAAVILLFGATIVHLWDIAATGNLAPGNTIQNVVNVVGPAVLIGLAGLSRRTADSDANSSAFLHWQARQQPIVGLAAAGVGIGFGIGFAIGGMILWTLVGTLVGVGIGIVISHRAAPGQEDLVMEQS